MRVLLAEDDASLRAVVVDGLADAGLIVDAVARGDDAIDHLSHYEYDVAVLDWRMPGATGVEVVRWARAHQRPTALLLLTARDTVTDRIEGLDAGADDYLVKPFDFGELIARIRALQRRGSRVDSSILVRGALEIDSNSRTAEVAGHSIGLTTTEFLILELLVRRAPSVVDRATIAQHAWPDETDPLGSNAIDVQLSRLRAKLRSNDVRIVTVRGMGYRLETP